MLLFNYLQQFDKWSVRVRCLLVHFFWSWKWQSSKFFHLFKWNWLLTKNLLTNNLSSCSRFLLSADKLSVWATNWREGGRFLLERILTSSCWQKMVCFEAQLLYYGICKARMKSHIKKKFVATEKIKCNKELSKGYIIYLFLLIYLFNLCPIFLP